jgi:hypothetical protein
VLPHITWPVVVLAVVLLFRLAVKRRDTWWRLIAGIGVMLAMLIATLIVCVVVLGTQVPGFRLPVLTWTSAPAATASPPATTSPRSSPMVTVSPAATASPSAWAFMLVTMDERDPCSETGEQLLRDLLAQHGLDPDHRPHVCELAGIPVA